MAGAPTTGEFTYCRNCGGGLITWVEGRCISCDALATPVKDFDHLTLLAVAFLTTLANVGRRSGAVSEDDIAFAFHAASANATRSRIEPSQLGGDDDNAVLIAELGDQLRAHAARIATNATALGYGDGLIAEAMRAEAAGILRDVAGPVEQDDAAPGTGFGDCPRCGLEYVLTEEGRCIICEVEESGLDVDSLLDLAGGLLRAIAWLAQREGMSAGEIAPILRVAVAAVNPPNDAGIRSVNDPSMTVEVLAGYIREVVAYVADTAESAGVADDNIAAALKAAVEGIALDAVGRYQAV